MATSLLPGNLLKIFLSREKEDREVFVVFFFFTSEKNEKVKILLQLASCFTSAPSSGIFSKTQAPKKVGRFTTPSTYFVCFFTFPF